MQPLPHRYAVVLNAAPEGDVGLSAAGLSTMSTDTPSEFGGSGSHWSPETLFVGAVGDCLALTFRGIARAWKLSWISLRCETEGTLDRVDGLMQFTEVVMRVHLGVADRASVEPAMRALERAERTCLIANSLKAAVRLDADVTVEEPVGELIGA